MLVFSSRGGLGVRCQQVIQVGQQLPGGDPGEGCRGLKGKNLVTLNKVIPQRGWTGKLPVRPGLAQGVAAAVAGEIGQVRAEGFEQAARKMPG